MNEYLSKMFGNGRGHAALAFKGPRWQQAFFAWPRERVNLAAWVTDHTDRGDVFICPALRSSRERVKGNAVHLRWLWADVDMQQVREQSERVLVRQRIAKIGSLVVASGTGDNRHVYVRLNREVTAEEHRRLNTGLRDYLSGDNKQSDDSLLRLPGTMNHKPGAGLARVRVVGGHGKRVDPVKLAAHPLWRDVRVVADGPGCRDQWAMVDVSTILRGGLKQRVRMSSVEATCRYGSRFKAINGVVKDLVKKGYDRDTIHTLLDGFPPAIDKAEDENGSYEIHKDIDRILFRAGAQR